MNDYIHSNGYEAGVSVVHGGEGECSLHTNPCEIVGIVIRADNGDEVFLKKGQPFQSFPLGDKVRVFDAFDEVILPMKLWQEAQELLNSVHVASCH